MKLNVRVNPATRAERFRRCGRVFAREWQVVEVDEATAARLRAEQMLEVAGAANTDSADETARQAMRLDAVLSGVAPAAPTPEPALAPKKPAKTRSTK
jgi:hypothetical protein